MTDNIQVAFGPITRENFYRRPILPGETYTGEFAALEKAQSIVKAMHDNKDLKPFVYKYNQIPHFTKKLRTNDDVIEFLYNRAMAKFDVFFLGNMLGFTKFGELHRDIADWLYYTRMEYERLGVIPRSNYKSTEIQLCGTINRILVMPSLRFAYLSPKIEFGVEEMAKPLMNYCANSEFLLNNFPEHFRPIKETDRELNQAWNRTKGRFDVLSRVYDVFTGKKRQAEELSATFRVVSEKATGTGTHNDVLLHDDVVNEMNYDSVIKREKAKKTLDFARVKTDAELADEISTIGNRITGTGTVYNSDDAVWSLMEQLAPKGFKTHISHGKDYVSMSLYYRPAWNIYDGKIHCIFPERYDEKTLKRMKRTMKPDRFRSQVELVPPVEFQNSFQPPYDFSEDGERCWKGDKVSVRPLNVAIGIDPGGTKLGSGTDDSAVTMLGVDAADVQYELDFFSGRPDTEDLFMTIWNMLLKGDIISKLPVHIDYEKVSAGDEHTILTFEKWIRKMLKRFTHIRPPIINPIKRTNTTSKQSYVESAFQLRWRNNTIKLHPRDFKIHGEFQSFPNGAHDDSIDSAATASHRLRDLVPKGSTTTVRPGEWDADSGVLASSGSGKTLSMNTIMSKQQRPKGRMFRI